MARSATVGLAYVPFRTMLTALDVLRLGIPDPLDRTIFKTFSGSTQGMLMTSLRALGAVDEQNRPEPILKRLVDPAQRKGAMRESLEATYAAILDVARSGTPRQLDQCFRDCGATGDTHDKAKSFFLQASRFAGLPLSSYIATGRRAPSRKGSGDDVERPPAPKASPHELRRVINLSCGGTIVLASIAVDYTRLVGDERDWLFKLFDHVAELEQRASIAASRAAAKCE